MTVRRLGAGKGEACLADHQSALARVSGEQPGLVCVHGPDDFLRLEAARGFQAAWRERRRHGEVVALRAAGEARPLAYSDVVDELSGGSLFSREKLVVVRQADRLLFPASAAKGGDGGASPDGEKRFAGFLEKPSGGVWLLLECASLPQNRSMGKKISACCSLVPCPAPTPGEAAKWLRARAAEQGKNLDPEAADLLLLAHGADLGVLASELEKLSLFADGERIDSGAVGEFLTGSVEFDIFGFTNAIEERNPVKALAFARKIAVIGSRDQKGKRDDGERSAHRALAMLAGTVAGLLRAGVASGGKRRAAAFAAAENVSPWRAEKLLAAAGRYSLRELRGMAGLTAEHLKRVHDTGGDARLALELLATRLAGGGRGG